MPLPRSQSAPRSGRGRGLAVVAVHVLLWGAAIVAIGAGLPRLQPYAQGWLADRPLQIEWINLPTWLSDPAYADVRRELVLATGLRDDDDISAPGLCERVAAQLLDPNQPAAAWIGELRSVQKTLSERHGPVVQIDAVFRQPFAFIAARGRVYVVDALGVRLPGEHPLETVDLRDWFVIEGASSPPPGLGAVWPGDDVQAGLKLVGFLNQAHRDRHLPFRNSIVAVDIANFHRKVDQVAGRLRLAKLGGGFIHWGEPPGAEFDIDGGATAVRKLQMLNTDFAQHGQLMPDEWIDVRYNDRIVRGDPRRR